MAKVITNDDGEVFLDDPEALGVIKAVNKSNCLKTFEMNTDRVAHFKQRIADLSQCNPMNFVIVILNVDDFYGGPIAELLMPGFDWQEIRDRGEVPFARGLAQRDAMQSIIGGFDELAAAKLQEMEDQIAVVVVDHNCAEVYQA